ncbi:alanine-zipper protein [Geomesophilobacter sediminis]|uniref:alanine-zipper protein n=1 Tax=Geomesophilobacter sediminis TaxID=2798584 RepID=UPI002E2E64BF|nr:alanine-zipper protein [Geomesophilobacter sediminis]
MSRSSLSSIAPLGLTVRLAAVALALAGSGCATRNYVKEQIDPLADRIGRLESRVKELDERLDVLEKRPVVTIEDLETLKDRVNAIGAQAQEALGTSQAAGARAEGAAQRAEAAAGRAETAADRAARAFELEQKK